MTVCVSPPAPTGFPFKTLLVIALIALLGGIFIGAGKLSSQAPVTPQVAQQEKQIEMERKKAEAEAYLQQLRLQQETERRRAEEQLAFIRSMHKLILDIFALVGLAIVLGIFAGTLVGIVLLVMRIASYKRPTLVPPEGYLVTLPTREGVNVDRTTQP